MPLFHQCVSLFLSALLVLLLLAVIVWISELEPEIEIIGNRKRCHRKILLLLGTSFVCVYWLIRSLELE